MNYSLFVSCPRGLEYLLEDELKSLGLSVTKVSPQGVYGDAPLKTVYQICLWSRLANRVQLILFSGKAHNDQDIRKLCTQFPWQTIFSHDKTIAVEFHGTTESIRNTMFGAQLVKDGLVDHFRHFNGSRPSVDKDRPQILIHAYLKRDELTVSLDLTGYSLHQRGYRAHAGSAPLKENVAAALLIRARWPEYLAQGFALYDPFCGAGTLVIEAALMAANRAPGLMRDDQSLKYWLQHQPELWAEVRAEAKAAERSVSLKIAGSDEEAKLVAIARSNAELAGVADLVRFQVKPVGECIEAPATQGLLVANPPYGERLGDPAGLVPVYQQLGEIMAHHFSGWQAAIITSNAMLAKAIGLRSGKQYTLFNGALECKLYTFSLDETNELKGSHSHTLTEHAQMLFNRLQKNAAHLKKWAKKNNISCYRVYDADLPEYAYAIDCYNDYVVLQEYAPPASVPEQKAQLRSLDVIQVAPKALGISPDRLVVKQRKRQRGSEQYQKMGESSKTMVVNEGRALLHVNLYDYLDTGLFLDHRPLRLSFSQLKPGTRFLNCFCYTASASVHAALAGAITTNVDLSNTYLNWAQDNFKLNNINLSRHQFIPYDCKEWLRNTRDRFDVIFLDPPSFSNSKRMTDTLDIQRDHASLIQSAMRLLNPDGVLYFSTNLRSFKMDARVLEQFSVQDISKQTIDIDFKRNSKIHYCFKIVMPQFA